MTIVATVQIDRPGRFAQIVLQLPDGKLIWRHGVTCYELENPATGTTVLAQVERGARYRSGYAQTVLLLGDFGIERPAQVRVHEVDSERTGEFQWHPAVRNARELFAGDEDKPTWNGHVAQQRRITNTDMHGLTRLDILTVFSNSPAVRIDSAALNGKVRAKQLAIDEFEPIFPVMPQNWDASYTIEEPLDTASGGFIEDLDNAYFPQRGRRVVRAVLCPSGTLPSDREDVRHAVGCGWSGAEYGIYRQPMPTLGLTVPQQKQKMTKQLAIIRDALHNGTAYPYPAYTNSKRYKLWHPLMGTEGGETGGSPATPVSWITMDPGIDLAYSGSADGMLLAMHEQRMALDRCATALHDDRCRPLTLEQFAGQQWSMRVDDARFDKNNSTGVTYDAPFGFSTQPPLPAGLCAEQSALDAFEPIDFGHFIREIRTHIALAWVCNDTLSRELLAQAGELARMSLFNGRAHGEQQGVAFHPQRGSGWQRIQGWQLRAIAEAFTFGGNPMRGRFLAGGATGEGEPTRVLQAIDGAFMENGCFQCDTVGKEHNHTPPYGGQYGVTISIHQGLSLSGAVAFSLALLGTGWRPDLLKGVEFLRRGQGTLWSAASRPIDPNATPFETRLVLADGTPCDSSHPQYQPSGQPLYDSEQTRALVGLHGLAAMRASDAAEVQRAKDMAVALLGPSPCAALRQMYAGSEDSDAILLSFCQAAGMP